MEVFKKDWFVKFVIPALLIIPFLALTIGSIQGKTATTDEDKHLIRGIMLLETGDFRLNQHHPFLFNAINSIPALFDGDLELREIPNELWEYADKDGLGRALKSDNGGEISFAENVLYGPRLTQIFISALFIVLFYTLLRGEFGVVPATIASTLLVFNTTFIAHSRLVTTDAPATITIFLASFMLYKYIRYGFKRSHLVWFIVASTVALLAKFTALLVAPFWIITIAVAHYRKSKGKVLQKLWESLKPVLIISISWLFILTAAHGFQFATFKEMDYGNQEKVEGMVDHLGSMSRKLGNPELKEDFVWVYENVKFPFPQYLRGFYANVFKHNYYGHSSFLLGEYSNGGQWYYFPVAFLTKESIGFTLLLTFSLGLYVAKVVKEKRIVGGVLTPLFITALILTLLSMQSTLNLGVRHLMPIYPFLFLAIGLVINKAWVSKNVRIVTIALLASVVGAALLAFPDYVSYFNLAIGGGENGYNYVQDSNFDWDQDKGFVEQYTLSYPGTTTDLSEIQYNERLIMRVETLFGNPDWASDEALALKKQVESGDLEPIYIIHDTYWVFYTADIDL